MRCRMPFNALFSALGHIQYELRDFRAAANAYEHLADLEPAHRTARFNLAICLGLLEEWNSAAESFGAAAQADATRADALLGQGVALLPGRSPPKHWIRWSGICASSPTTSMRYLPAEWRCNRRGKQGRHGTTWASASHKVDNFAKAIEDDQKAITINPSAAQAHLNLGAALKNRAISPGPGSVTRKRSNATRTAAPPCGTWP
jgi:tetratricopeptide (TPR) repeat protein